MHAATSFVLGTALISSVFLGGNAAQEKLLEPPRQYEGLVRFVDVKAGRIMSLTVTVKEQVPTKMEDFFREVERDYQFRLNESTMIFGIDGKPDQDPVQSLKQRTRVRVEAKDKLAVEIRVLPPKD